MPTFNHDLKLAVRRVARRAGILEDAYRFANTARILMSRRMTDEQWAVRKYAENTGRKLDLRNPTTFNEKIWWLKLHNRDPLLTVCSDKVAVRRYVTDAGYGHTLNQIYGVFDDINEVDLACLTLPAYLKTNNGSGANMVVPAEGRVDQKRIVKRFKRALNTNYFWQSREWNYRNIEPKIVAEKLLPNAEQLTDYRFFCFNGRVRLVFVDRNAAKPDGTHSPRALRNVHDASFQLLNVKVFLNTYPDSPAQRPPNYAEMVAMAERLSQPFPFVRVDLYNIEGEIRFGEMTFYPGGGCQIAEPLTYEQEWGSWIDLHSPKIVLGA